MLPLPLIVAEVKADAALAKVIEPFVLHEEKLYPLLGLA
jgi:hypothetical protein